MNDNINKNISIWRGSSFPPTEYHLWLNEDGVLLIRMDEQDWTQLASLDDKTILDNLQYAVEIIQKSITWE